MTTVLFGQIRAFGAAVGGVLVALGYVDEATFNIVLGAVFTIASAGWSAYEKLTAPK